jgi:hypothetical protein
VIICEIIVHLLVIVQNDKRCTVQGIEISEIGLERESEIESFTEGDVTRYLAEALYKSVKNPRETEIPRAGGILK